MPRAVVAHAHPVRRRRRTSTTPPGGECRAALSSRLLTARASRSRVPSTHGRLQLRLEPHARRVAARARDRLARRARRAARPRCSRRGSSPRASSIRSATSMPSSVVCSSTSASSRARSSGGSASDSASTSMFVRRRVIGVRSSCEASATSWRCAAIERSSVSSIALKCAASSPTSSWLVDLDPAPEVLGRGDVARGLGHVRDRRDDVARDEPAEQRPRARRRPAPRAAGSAAAARAPSRSARASGRAAPRRPSAERAR